MMMMAQLLHVLPICSYSAYMRFTVMDELKLLQTLSNRTKKRVLATACVMVPASTR